MRERFVVARVRDLLDAFLDRGRRALEVALRDRHFGAGGRERGSHATVEERRREESRRLEMLTRAHERSLVDIERAGEQMAEREGHRRTRFVEDRDRERTALGGAAESVQQRGRRRRDQQRARVTLTLVTQSLRGLEHGGHRVGQPAATRERVGAFEQRDDERDGIAGRFRRSGRTLELVDRRVRLADEEQHAAEHVARRTDLARPRRPRPRYRRPRAPSSNARVNSEARSTRGRSRRARGPASRDRPSPAARSSARSYACRASEFSPWRSRYHAASFEQHARHRRIELGFGRERRVDFLHGTGQDPRPSWRSRPRRVRGRRVTRRRVHSGHRPRPTTRAPGGSADARRRRRVRRRPRAPRRGSRRTRAPGGSTRTSDARAIARSRARRGRCCRATTRVSRPSACAAGCARSGAILRTPPRP